MHPSAGINSGIVAADPAQLAPKLCACASAHEQASTCQLQADQEGPCGIWQVD